MKDNKFPLLVKVEQNFGLTFFKKVFLSPYIVSK